MNGWIWMDGWLVAIDHEAATLRATKVKEVETLAIAITRFQSVLGLNIAQDNGDRPSSISLAHR
jgi:hypothetical protein